jgi:hypothetical protein
MVDTNSVKQSPSTNSTEFNTNSITGVINTILTGLSVPDEPAEALPSPLILSGGALRSGLSPIDIVSNIIARESQAQFPVGNVYADGNNRFEAMLMIIVEEILTAIATKGVVNVAINPGIPCFVTGVGNEGAPVISQGFTTDIGTGSGIII